MLYDTDHSKPIELSIAFFKRTYPGFENVNQEQIDALSDTKALAGGETATG